METVEVIRAFSSGRRVGGFDRPNRRLLPCTHTSQVSEISSLSCAGSGLPIQSPTLRHCNSSIGVHLSSEGGKVHSSFTGGSNPSVFGRLAGEGQGIRILVLGDVQKLVNLVEKLGWIVNLKKSELSPTQDLEFLGYRFNLREGLVYPNQKKLNKFKILAVSILQGHTTTPRKLMSLIGVMASMEKTVPSGRIHMRPFQWFLKTNWHFPQSFGQGGSSFSVVKGPSGLVDGSSEFTQGFESASERTQYIDVHRCIREGLGGPLEQLYL